MRNAMVRAVGLALLFLLLSACADVTRTAAGVSEETAQARLEQTDEGVAIYWSTDHEISDPYVLMRRINGENWEELAALDATAEGYVDTDVSVGGVYEYRIHHQTVQHDMVLFEGLLVYDAIRGKTVQAVELPVDSDGDGSVDGYRSFPLVDASGDGRYDGIDLDGKPGTAEMSLFPTDRPGVYRIDTNNDGVPDFEYDLAAGGTSGYQPGLVRSDDAKQAAVIPGEGDDPPAGISVDGTFDHAATDVLRTALSKRGRRVRWPSAGPQEPDVAMTILSEYPPAPGAVDLDGDGRADAWIIADQTDSQGTVSYELDVSGDGSGDLWLSGSPYIRASDAPGLAGTNYAPTFDDDGVLLGFGVVDDDRSVSLDTKLTDPIATADPGAELRVPTADGRRVRTVAQGTAGQGLDVTGDGTADIPLVPLDGRDQSADAGVYGIDTNGDGGFELYMHTFPGLRFTDKPDGSGTQYQIVFPSDDRPGFGTLSSDEPAVDRGFLEDDGGPAVYPPSSTVPTLAISDHTNQSATVPVYRPSDKVSLTAALSAGSATTWEVLVNGTVHEGGSSSDDGTRYTFPLTPGPEGLDLAPGRVHRVTFRAHGVMGKDIVAGLSLAETHLFALSQ